MMIKSYTRYACLGSTAILRFPHLMPDSEKQGFKPDFTNCPPELAIGLFSEEAATATKH